MPGHHRYHTHPRFLDNVASWPTQHVATTRRPNLLAPRYRTMSTIDIVCPLLLPLTNTRAMSSDDTSYIKPQ